MDILVIKTGALGDVLRTSFIAQALKDKYKEHKPRIFWISDKKAIPLFVNNPYVDRVLTSEEKGSIKDIPFDIIINLEEDEENCKFTSMLKSRKIAGFYWENGKVVPSESAKEWFDMSALGKKPENDILKKKNKKTHRQIIAEIVGIKNYEKYEPFLRLNPRQRRFVYDFLRRHNLSRKELIVGINTGAADRWPKSLSVGKTAELIDKIYQKYNAKILLFGGPNEIERNREILVKSKAPVIITGCGNDLIEFPALISVCTLIVTSDSLGLHIALALKRKTICLLGPTSSSEIEVYGIGKKIIADSRCVCCYKKECKSMEKISIEKIMGSISETIKEKISVIITAFKEPEIGRAIEAAINQKTEYDYNIFVSAPDEETLDIARKYAERDRRIKIIKDAGKGKSFALNMLLENLDSDIVILTDGDVYISENSVESVVSHFSDPEIGCVTGRPVPMESRETKYGYWANFLFEAAHKWRKDAFEKHSFVECSGYLFAFRKKKINKIPLDVAEDTVIPYFFWEKGYRVGYAEDAKVYVKNVDNLTDWLKQKTRTSKAHETLSKYVDTSITPRVKTFSNESRGIWLVLTYPSNFSEVVWSFQLAAARFLMWMKVFFDTRLKGKHYGDAWERVESTK